METLVKRAWTKLAFTSESDPVRVSFVFCRKLLNSTLTATTTTTTEAMTRTITTGL